MDVTGSQPELVPAIDAAALDHRAWSSVLVDIGERLRARAMSLTITDPASPSASFVVAPRSDRFWCDAYRTRWAASNPLRDRGCQTPIGEVYSFDMLGMTRSECDENQFYKEFLRPQGLDLGLILIAAREPAAVSAIGFYRSFDDGPFGASERRLLDELSPHLRRAVAMNLRLSQIEMQRDSAVALLNRSEQGAILLDATARILFVNAAAEAMLRRDCGLHIDGGKLAARERAKTAALRSLVAAASRDGADGVLAVSTPEGTRLLIEIVPHHADAPAPTRHSSVMVFINDPHAGTLPSRDHIQLLFDLTPAQARVAEQLLTGDGIPGVAARLGISRSTARTHLIELFQRTGTSHQAELVRTILQLTPIRDTAARQSSARQKGRAAAWRIKASLLSLGVFSSDIADLALALAF